MQDWDFLIEKQTGLLNMRRDVLFFDRFEKQEIKSKLCIYSWEKPCISLGYSQKPGEELDLALCETLGFDVVVRPTGGGIVFHNTDEVSYSIVTAIDNPILPKGLIPSYKKISEAVVYALKKLGIDASISSKLVECQQSIGLCFSYPAEYEIVYDGKKIVGSAQKRGKKTLLQQGSIFMTPIDEAIFSVLKKSYDKHNAISVKEALGRSVYFTEMKDSLACGFKNVLGVNI